MANDFTPCFGCDFTPGSDACARSPRCPGSMTEPLADTPRFTFAPVPAFDVHTHFFYCGCDKCKGVTDADSDPDAA